MISKNEVFEEYLLIEAKIVDEAHLAFCAIHGPAKEDDVYISQIFYCDLVNWQAGVYHNMEVVSMTGSPFGKEEFYLLDREGEYLRVYKESKQVFDFKSFDDVVGPFRKIRKIGNELYVIGEDRSVWVMKDSIWRRQERGLPEGDSLPDVDDTGFDEDRYLEDLIEKSEVIFSISGSGPNDLCMVGTLGEIWTWDGGFWSKESTPTNQNLYDVYCISEGQYIICGQNGTILEGGNRRWRLIETDNESSDFCSITKYRDKWYLADGHDLFEFDGDTLSQVNFGVDENVPSHFVVSSDQIILSIAAKEAFFCRDGVAWKSLLM